MNQHNNIICNVDTDAVLISKPDGAPWSKEEQYKFIELLNEQFPEKINFEHDGYYPAVVIFRSKNYAMLDDKGKLKIKGSSIKDQKKEPALREMMDKMIEAMIYDKQHTINDIYTSYIKEVLNIKDIKRWCQKKSISESVLDCANPTDDTRKNEMDIWDAIKNEADKQQGNKIYLYPVILGQHVESGRISEKTGKPLKDKVTEINGLKLDKYWNNDHNVDKLIERVYSTLKIFGSVLDLTQFIDYSSAKNKHLLEGLNASN